MLTSLNLKSLFPVIVLFFCVLSPSAQAEERITEDAIRAFYQETTDIMTHEDRDWDKAIAKLDGFLHEDFKSIARMTMEVPGHGTLTPIMSHNKKLYLEEMKFYKVLDAYFETVEHSLEEIEISEDGKTAYVSDKSYAVMNTKALGGKQGREVTALTSQCNDTVVLSKKGELKLLEINCDVVSEIPKDL